jgi:hypothetical protein
VPPNQINLGLDIDMNSQYPYSEALAKRDADNGYPETNPGDHNDFVKKYINEKSGAFKT